MTGSMCGRVCGERITLIAQTGWGHETDRRRTRESGLGHHIAKPVDPKASTAVLQQGFVGRR